MMLFFVCIALLPIFCSAQVKLTNIDYLGLGYDAILGNPQNDLQDPGFRQAVLQLEYTKHSMSSDGKWHIPDSVQALQTVACSYHSTSTMVMGSTSYQNSLSVDAEVHGEGFGAKFSASAGFKEVRESTNNYHRSYVSSVARCLLYKASILRLAPIRVSPIFVRAVNSLPAKQDDAAYQEFISVFGTHYASALDMGAKMVIMSEFDQTAWTTLEQNNFNFRVAAEASFSGVTGGGSVMTEMQRQMMQTYESKRRSKKVSYIGSRPSTDGRWETWAQTTESSPYPISYTLRPLTDLFTQIYLPSVDPFQLATKRQLLVSVFATYCNRVPNCGVPFLDPVSVRMDRVETNIQGIQTTSCRPGYSLLSCGIKNLPKRTCHEVWRYSIPVSHQTCKCYDYFGATCVAWCTNTVKKFQVVPSPVQTGTFRVSCPSGQKVLGCSIAQHTWNRKPEKWRHHYPTDDGNGCMCYDYYGAQCYASCAANIRNHEIVTQFGTGFGLTTATCSPNNFVLGCGMRPGRGGPEKWRAVFVSSLHSCQCYDYYGATCYAICGQFT